MDRLFAIPDIHGRKDLLERLILMLKSSHFLDLTSDKLIFMGDMIDRGPDSRGVLDIIMKLKFDHPTNVIALFGNHEQFMVNAMRRGRYDDFANWCYPSNGGRETLKSFGLGGISGGPGIPEAYVSWIENLPLFHEEPGFFFSHAPIPKDRSPEYLGKPYTPNELIWTFFDDESGKSRHHKDKDGNSIVGVCGHIHRLKYGIFNPRYYPHYLFLDAGCGCHEKAPLICTEVRARTPIEIWPSG